PCSAAGAHTGARLRIRSAPPFHRSRGYAAPRLPSHRPGWPRRLETSAHSCSTSSLETLVLAARERRILTPDYGQPYPACCRRDTSPLVLCSASSAVAAAHVIHSCLSRAGRRRRRPCCPPAPLFTSRRPGWPTRWRFY